MGHRGTILITFASPSPPREVFYWSFRRSVRQYEQRALVCLRCHCPVHKAATCPQVLPCVESVVSSMAKRRMIVRATGRSTACVVSMSVTSLSSLSAWRKRITGKIAKMGIIQNSYLRQGPVKVPTSCKAKHFRSGLSQRNSSEKLRWYSSHRRKCGIKRRSDCDLRQRMHGRGAAMRRFAA